MSHLRDGDTFTLKGHTFRLEIAPDDGLMSSPWTEYEGHGKVREVTRGYHSRIEKKPGERVLYDVGYRDTSYLYNWQEAIEAAKRDGWGLCEAKRPTNWDTLTKGQQAALAVQADFDYLRGYCAGDWQYIGVMVIQLDPETELEVSRDSLWGIESNASEYITETANELALAMADSLDKEALESADWAARGLVTVAA